VKGYVYKFYNAQGELLYVGKTSNLTARMTAHKLNGHLGGKVYEEVSRVEYAELPTYADAGILERYYIGKLEPKYNIQYSKEGIPTIDIDDSFAVWKPIKFDPLTVQDNRKELLRSLTARQMDTFYAIILNAKPGKNEITVQELSRQLNRRVKSGNDKVLMVMKEMTVRTARAAGHLFRNVSFSESTFRYDIANNMFPTIKALQMEIQTFFDSNYLKLPTLAGKKFYRWLLESDSDMYIPMSVIRAEINVPEYEPSNITDKIVKPAVAALNGLNAFDGEIAYKTKRSGRKIIGYTLTYRNLKGK